MGDDERLSDSVTEVAAGAVADESCSVFCARHAEVMSTATASLGTISTEAIDNRRPAECGEKGGTT